MMMNRGLYAHSWSGVQATMSMVLHTLSGVYI